MYKKILFVPVFVSIVWLCSNSLYSRCCRLLDISNYHRIRDGFYTYDEYDCYDAFDKNEEYLVFLDSCSNDFILKNVPSILLFRYFNMYIKDNNLT